MVSDIATFHTFKWWIIAKAEYQIVVNTLAPGSKRYSAYLLLALSLVYIFVLAPMIVGSIIRPEERQLSTMVALAFLKIVLLIASVSFLTFPFSLAIKEIKTKEIELFLAAPVKASDLLLGEFFGRLPFYSIFGIVIGGFYLAVLEPLHLDLLQILISVGAITLIFIISIWISTVCGNVLRIRLLKSSRGRDLGKAISFLIMLPFIFILYGILGSVLNTIENASSMHQVDEMLSIFPSTWAAEVILSFAEHPGPIAIWSQEVYYYLGGLIVLFLIVTWLGFFFTNKIYNLEPISFSNYEINTQSRLYHYLQALSSKNINRVILTTEIRKLLRQSQYLTKILYCLGLYSALILFISRANDMESVFMMNLVFITLIVSFTVSEFTLGGKESLIIIKMSPIGNTRFLTIKIVEYWLIIVPIVLVVNILITMVIPNPTLDQLFLNIIYNIIISMIVTTEAIILAFGLFLHNPAFNDKAPEFMINMQLMIFGTIIAFFALLITLSQQIMFLYVQLLFITLYCLMSLSIFITGSKRFERFE